MIISPASLPQEMFINSDADITIASGSAGSSKSYSILLQFLRYIHDPNTTGVIFRRTSGQIMMPGGLWSEAIALYSQIDPKLRVRSRDMEIIFSTGAKLKFSHFENEAAKIKMRGLQAGLIAFDEMTEFTEEMVTYLLSRLRNTKVKYKPQLFGATNPDYNSFLLKWVEWWLDPVTGIPDRSKNGVKRYFRRNGSEMHWADTREELEKVYGSEPGNGILSMMVIGSNCFDNPFLDADYTTRLQGLSRVERDRLLYGSWFAREEAAGYFKRDWVTVVPFAPLRAEKRIRAWDLAGTLPSEVNKDPDWTVGTLLSKSIHGRYTVEDVVRFRERFHGVEQKIFAQAEEDGKDVTIILPIDPGSASKAYGSTIVQRLAEKGFTARLKPNRS